mgnify:CR=1 FL=1
MKKKIYLIGLNLYSIFLSLKIKKDFKDFDISIIEASNNFLKAYQSIKIKNYNVNPGFHAFEKTRSEELIKFLKKIISLKTIYKTRGILIQNNIISYTDSFDLWPKEIIKKYKLKRKQIRINPINNIEYLNKNYLNYLTTNYFGKEVKFRNTISSAYPWFFPPNYDIASNDEGSVFNSKIRKKKINHAFVFPSKGAFYDIALSIKKLLKKEKIRIEFNKPINFLKKNKSITYEGYSELNKNNNKKIVCVPVVPLTYFIKQKKQKISLKPVKYYTGLIEIKNFIKSDIDQFTEIITSSEFAYGLTRISLYSEIFDIKKKIYQIEFIEHSYEVNTDIQVKKIISFISKFIKFKSKNVSNIKLIDYSFVRNIFRPNKRLIDKLVKKSVNFFDDSKNVIFPRQITWPINSNKHLHYATEDYNKIIKKFLNDQK